MTKFQQFLERWLPSKLFQSIQSESSAWILTCPCGQKRSVWEIGGVRWKASGTAKRLLPCSGCGQNTWQTLTYEEPSDAANPTMKSS